MGVCRMKVKFLGIKNQPKRTGCSSCGSRRVSKHTFQREKRLILPNGQSATFHAGEMYEVTSHDGLFLISQVYNLNGVPTKMFKQVE